MADATYQPKTYRKQGGDEYVVADGGLLTVESGGEVTVESGGTLTLDSGSVLASRAAVAIQQPAIGATITNYGISSVGTSSGTTAYVLGAPAVGITKILMGSTAVGGAVTISSSLATVGSTGDTITIGELGGACTLVGLTTAIWRVVGMSTGVAFS